MNKTAGIFLGIIGIVAIALIIFFGVKASKNSTTNVTVTQTPGTGTTDQPGSSTKTPGVPVAVTNPNTSPTDTTAIVTGVVTPTGAFTSYWYEYGTSSNSKTATSKQAVGSGYATTAAPGYITGLAKNTTYYFRIIAENQYGRVSGSQYSFRTTEGNPAPVGGAPTVRTLDANGTSRTEADLHGEVTPNRASTQYWFEYGKTQDLGNTTALVNAGNSSVKTSASASVSNLEPLTTYYFRLNAQNQFGTVTGSILNFKTGGPAAQNAPSATTQNAGNTQGTTATLHATINPNGAETSYWFEYGTGSAINAVLLNATDKKSTGTGTKPMSVQADISRLVSNTTYYFQIVAENGLGMVRGDRVSFKTK